MAARAEAVFPLAFYEAPKSQLNAVLSCKNYSPPPHFSFLASLPVATAGPPEQGEPAHPAAPHAAGQRSPLGHTEPPALGGPGVPRGSGGSDSRRPRRSNSSPARRGRGRTRFPPRDGEGERRPRGGAAARPGCRGTQVLTGGGGGGGARVGKRLRKQQKKDLKVRRREETKWLSLPSQPVLTRRLHVGGKLQTSVENSDTPGINNDKRNSNDNNDNAFPYIKT